MVFETTPRIAHSLRRSSVATTCNAIKPGMTLEQASEAVRRKYVPDDERYTPDQAVFSGQEWTCVMDLDEKDRHVVGTHVRPGVDFRVLE
jgi:hypothetical protein